MQSNFCGLRKNKLYSPSITAPDNTKKYTVLFIIFSTLIATLFITYPQIDLYISSLFYKEGMKFYLDENIIFVFIRHVVEALVLGFAVLWIGLLANSFIRRRAYIKEPVFGLSRIRIIYLILALLVGPGLVVNTIFKDQWGRARPSQVTQFGGDKVFTPAFIISDQCKNNCSFVSGDPSVGFYIFALALAMPKRRKLFSIAALGFGGVFGITRIVQGGHFFSDVIFSGIFTFTTVYLLYLLMLKVERSLQKKHA